MSVFGQIRTMIAREIGSRPVLYVLIIVSQIVSVMCVFFVNGLIANAYSNFEDADYEERYLYFQLKELKYADDFLYDGNGEDVPEVGGNGEISEDVLAEAEEKAQKANYETFDLAMPFSEVKDSLKEIFNSQEENILNLKLEGRIRVGDEYVTAFSNYYGENSDDYNNGEYGDTIICAYNSGYKEGDKIVIGGREFTVTKLDDHYRFYFNMTKNTPDDFKPLEVSVDFARPLMYDEQKNIVDKFKFYLSPVKVYEPEGASLLDIQMSNNQILMSRLLILIAVLNCSLCYVFIYQSRRKMFAIFRICGAQKVQCFMMCLLEAFMYMAFSYISGYLIFDKGIRKAVEKFYPMSMAAYTADSYKMVLTSYFAITLVIMSVCILVHIGKPVVEERR